MDDRRIPPSIRPLLADYTALLRSELPNLADGSYLHGSIALDAFNERFSDIDFVTVLSRRARADEIAALARLHRTLAARYPRWLLEGSYLQWADLGQPRAVIPAYPCVHENRLDPAGHFDVNHVTWWLLRNHGIALFGPDATALPFAVDWATLRAAMHENLNAYWGGYTRSPRSVASLLTDDGVQWTVLGVLRQLYSFREHAIISKSGAGRYALEHLPARWHRIVAEALALREGAGATRYGSRAVRAVEALRLLRYVVKTANAEIARAAEPR